MTDLGVRLNCPLLSGCWPFMRRAAWQAKASRWIGEFDIRYTEREMHEMIGDACNYASPKALAELLEWFYAHHDSNEYLSCVWDLMVGCNTGSGRLPAAVDEGDVVVHKTGTGFPSPGGGVSAINDAGIILHPDGSHTVIVVFVTDSPEDPASTEAFLAGTARMLLGAQW